MVCLCCKLRVEEELDRLGIHYVRVELGVVELMEEITPVQREQLRTNLLSSGLDLIEDKKRKLVENIKTTVIEMIRYADELPKVKYSLYISEKLNLNYTYLNNLFSKETGVNIQHYIINIKTEWAKELISEGELNFSEIAYLLQYNSESHFSKQFHQITGLSPSDYKHLEQKPRINLENV